MTTSEAYAYVNQLKSGGASNKSISKALADKGYLSYKTGKPIKTNSIATMVMRARDGLTPRDKKPRRVFVNQNPARTGPTKWDIAKMIDESTCFLKSTKTALLELIIQEGK